MTISDIDEYEEVQTDRASSARNIYVMISHSDFSRIYARGIASRGKSREGILKYRRSLKRRAFLFAIHTRPSSPGVHAEK